MQIKEQRPKLTITLERPSWLSTSLSVLKPDEAARLAAEGHIRIDWLDGLEEEECMPSKVPKLPLETKLSENRREKENYLEKVTDKVQETLQNGQLSPDTRLHTAYLVLHHASKERIAGRRRHDNSKWRNDRAQEHAARKRHLEDEGGLTAKERRDLDRNFEVMMRDNKNKRICFGDIRDNEVPFRALKYVRDVTENKWRRNLVNATKVLVPTTATGNLDKRPVSAGHNQPAVEEAEEGEIVEPNNDPFVSSLRWSQRRDNDREEQRREAARAFQEAAAFDSTQAEMNRVRNEIEKEKLSRRQRARSKSRQRGRSQTRRKGPNERKQEQNKPVHARLGPPVGGGGDTSVRNSAPRPEAPEGTEMKYRDVREKDKETSYAAALSKAAPAKNNTARPTTAAVTAKNTTARPTTAAVTAKVTTAAAITASTRKLPSYKAQGRPLPPPPGITKKSQVIQREERECINPFDWITETDKWIEKEADIGDTPLWWSQLIPCSRRKNQQRAPSKIDQRPARRLHAAFWTYFRFHVLEERNVKQPGVISLDLAAYDTGNPNPTVSERFWQVLSALQFTAIWSRDPPMGPPWADSSGHEGNVPGWFYKQGRSYNVFDPREVPDYLYAPKGVPKNLQSISEEVRGYREPDLFREMGRRNAKAIKDYQKKIASTAEKAVGPSATVSKAPTAKHEAAATTADSHPNKAESSSAEDVSPKPKSILKKTRKRTKFAKDWSDEETESESTSTFSGYLSQEEDTLDLDIKFKDMPALTGPEDEEIDQEGLLDLLPGDSSLEVTPAKERKLLQDP